MTRFDPDNVPLEEKWLYSWKEVVFARNQGFCMGAILASTIWITIYGVFLP